MFIIYKHTSPSGKSYIGQTKYSIEERLKGHLVDCKNGSERHFHQAIRKYGIENFTSEILEENIETQNEADLKETYYIQKFDSFRNGYNMTEEGKGSISGPERVKINKRGAETCRKNGWYEQLAEEQSKRQLEVQGDGRTKAQHIREKQYNNQLKDIDENGFNGAQRAAFKYHENMKNAIDKETGLTKAQLRNLKHSKTAKEKGSYKGENNSAYGMKWIYNSSLQESKRVPKNEIDNFLKRGWEIGMKREYCKSRKK